MEIHHHESADGSIELSIAGPLVIHRAAEFKHQLAEFLNQGRPLVLNFQGVTELDSAGVQILIGLHNEAQQLEAGRIRLLNFSPAMKPALELYRITQLEESSG